MLLHPPAAGAGGLARKPTAFDRMVKECLRIGLPISGVRVPF